MDLYLNNIKQTFLDASVKIGVTRQLFIAIQYNVDRSLIIYT